MGLRDALRTARPKWRFKSWELACLCALMIVFGANLSRCVYSGDWSGVNSVWLVALGCAAWSQISRVRLREQKNEAATPDA